MGNSFRCCLACVLPCGALDVVRVVHMNGHVEEYSRQVSASEILAANPNHIISKPCEDHVVQRIVIVSPESELKRGHIYFLIPSSAIPEKKMRNKDQIKTKSVSTTTSTIDMSDQDDCLKKILLEKKSRHYRRKSGRVGIRRPHLEAITESP